MKSAEMSAVDVCGEACVTPEGGEQLYTVVRDLFRTNVVVRVDFAGVKYMTSSFANNSVGRLCSELGDDFVRIHLTNLDEVDRKLMDLVIKNARRWSAERAEAGPSEEHHG